MLEMCGLPANEKNEGMSLVPLLRDPSQEWRFAVLTTYAWQNHALRSSFWYLRMEDGSEEFYDHRTDPNEWTNLAGKKKYAKEIKEFRSALPEKRRSLPSFRTLRPDQCLVQGTFVSQRIEVTF